MKTVERLDFPVIVTRDGNASARHEHAAIVFTHGAPAYVRAQEPFAIYPWEVVRQINRTSDEVGAWLDTGGKVDDPDLTERLRASVAAIADERNGAKQEAHALREEVARVQALHTEHRLALRAALGLRDDEAADNATGDFKTLCERVASLRSNYESAYRVAHINADDAHRLSNDVANLKADLASVTEQRDVLKRQLEELRAEMRNPPKNQVGPTFEEQVKACRELNPHDEPNPDNRDSYRSTALRAGAKDCALYIGPKPSDLTFVVEMREGAKVFDVVAALEHEHGLQPEAYRIREVRAPTP